MPVPIFFHANCLILESGNRVSNPHLNRDLFTFSNFWSHVARNILVIEFLKEKNLEKMVS